MVYNPIVIKKRGLYRADYAPDKLWGVLEPERRTGMRLEGTGAANNPAPTGEA